MDYEDLAAQWLNEQRLRQVKPKAFKKAFIGARGYEHFDTPINLQDSATIGSLVSRMSSVDAILKWQFLPFVTKYKRTRKYRHSSSIDPADTNQKHRTHLKSRPTMAASHADACIYSFLGYILEPAYEKHLKKHFLNGKVLAYRSTGGQNNIDFAMRAFTHIENHDGVTGIFLDIKGFFDNIPHTLLLDAVANILNGDIPKELSYILQNVTQYRYINQENAIKELKNRHASYMQRVSKSNAKVISSMADYNQYLENRQFIKKNHTGRGIPQGSSISGILANIAMLEFDKFSQQLVEQYKSGFYQRYSDDITFIVPTKYAQTVYCDLVDKLGKMGFSISKAKTEAFTRDGDKLINVTKSFEPSAKDTRQNAQYLGIEWNGASLTLRPGTIAKRFRARNKLHKKFWRYSKMAIKKTNSSSLAKQQHRIRKTIKSKLQ